MGDRMRQVAGGITTTYTLDLNAGLTQVLADGTNTYLYGPSTGSGQAGRIAQYAGTTPAYFLGDALGSVRQLANASGAVTLARSYEPFGNTLSSMGSGTTNYNFAGEWRDSYIKLLYLRARWYSGDTGRFTTRDVWARSYRRPMSFNAWLYTYANPINLTDPSGQVPCDMLPPEDQIEAGCVSPADVRLTFTGEKYIFNGEIYTRQYGGNEVKILYRKMKDSACGWWNAETDGLLTFEEFNGLWVIHEGDDQSQPMMWVARAAAQNLFVGGWNYPYCPGGVGSCFNGVFNFWAAYSEVVHTMTVQYVRNNIPIEQYNGKGLPPGVFPKGAAAVALMDKADRYGRLMLYPPVLDSVKNHGPSQWGNRNAWTKFMNDPANGPVATRGSNQSQIYFTSGNFLVYSVEQYNYWKFVLHAPVDQP
jgi:RHS repeat-associated protein